MNESELKVLADQALQKLRDTVKSLPQDNEFAKANQHVMASSSDRYFSVANQSIVGAGWYLMTATFGFANLKNFGGVSFKSSAFDWAAIVGSSVIVGDWLVDPRTVNGSCSLLLAVAAGEIGALTITLYSEDKTKVYGIFAGAIGGIGAVAMANSGS